MVEKALSSGPSPAGPGEAFRRVLEIISSGIFLPGMLHSCWSYRLLTPLSNLKLNHFEGLQSACFCVFKTNFA